MEVGEAFYRNDASFKGSWDDLVHHQFFGYIIISSMIEAWVV